MKKEAAIKTRRFKSARYAKKLGWQEALKYLVYFAFFYLFAMAKTDGGLAPFNLGFLSALVFCRENLLYLAPLYVAAQVAAAPAFKTFLLALLPPLIMGIASAIHYFLKKPIKMLAVNLYALISQLPVVILSAQSLADVSASVITVAVSQAFTYCCVIIGYAVLVRGMRYKLTADEKAAACIVAAALGLGLFRLKIGVYRPFWTIAAFLSILFAYCFDAKHAFVLTFVLGFGASLAERSFGIASALLLGVMGASIFSKNNVYFAAAAVLLCDALSGVFFKAFGVYDWVRFASFAAGLLVFVLIPRKRRERILAYAGNFRQQNGVRTLVNRNRAEVCAKLKEISGVFSEMQRLLGACPLPGGGAKAMAEELTLSVCADCPNRSECFSALGSDTSGVLLNLTQAAEERGKATLLDVPTFLSSRCRRINLLVEKSNGAAEAYRRKKKSLAEAGCARAMMGDQMGGVANMLSNLAEEVKKTVTFDGERERRIIDELCYNNIVAKEAVVTCRADGQMEVLLVLREKDSGKKALSGVVGAIMKANFAVTDVKKLKEQEGYAAVRLATKTKYGAVYGEAGMTKNGSDASGDTRSVRRIGEDKLLVALCDGMGSGGAAEKNSSTAISMLENMYGAGFGNEAALSLVNRLLSLRSDDDFSALDMCVVDLRTGGVDFIKQGACEGLIIRAGSVEVVKSNALPLGIIEEAEPSIERRILNEGDTLVMFSDGIVEAVGMERLISYAEKNRVINPQMLADNILLMATAGGRVREDDCTVIAARIYLS